jgi:predicted metalloprotease with PDZ domain
MFPRHDAVQENSARTSFLTLRVRVEKGNGTIRFAVTWEARSVRKNSTVTKRGMFTADRVAWDGKDYEQLAERLSGAIASVSEAIATALPMEAKTPTTRKTNDTGIPVPLPNLMSTFRICTARYSV